MHMQAEIDLAELAKLRFIEKWSMQKLARHFRCGTVVLYQRLVTIAKEDEK